MGKMNEASNFESKEQFSSPYIESGSTRQNPPLPLLTLPLDFYEHAPDHQTKNSGEYPVPHTIEGPNKIDPTDIEGDDEGSNSLLHPSLQSLAPWLW